MTSVSIFDIRIDDLGEETLREQLCRWLQSGARKLIVTPNPEIVLEARRDLELRELLNGSALSLPDGVGLRYATAALTDLYLQHRHTGVDVLLLLAELCAREGKRLCLIGGAPDGSSVRLERSVKVLEKVFPGLDVVSYNPGIVDGAVGRRIATQSDNDAIRELAPDVIAVGLGSGTQEQFILDVFEEVSEIRIGIGVGGAFDMISGSLPRAPEKLRSMGLEWVWRLYLQPKRIKRIFTASIYFPIVVACDTLKRRRFLRACKRVFPEVFRQIKGL